MDLVKFGPAHGTLSVRTDVQGRAAKMGHRLTMTFQDWDGSVTFDGPVPVAAQLRAALPSLEVLGGEGGVLALTDADRVTIRRTALRAVKADLHPGVLFESDRVRPTSHGYTLDGRLSVAGRDRDATVEVFVTGTGEAWQLTAQAQVVQSEYGIRPYSAFLGALQVQDRVQVGLAVSLPRGAAAG